jgi:hypothetical protein
MFASVVLGLIVEIAAALEHPESHANTAERALRLRTAIDAGIRDHAVIDDPATGPRWAYEVDGRGARLEMDDANIPSLLALPLIGYCDADDPTYVATRTFVLSDRNPYYYRGAVASGIGSPHTPRRHVWPIALATAALTSTNPADKRAAIDVLLATDAGTTRMHESFHVDRPNRWTRDWFSWAEAMFAELVLDTCGYTYPETTARPTIA